MATDGQPQIIDGGMQPKPAIFVLSLVCIARNRKFESTSLQQTVRLSPDFAFVPGKARVLRRCGGDARQYGRQRPAKSSNIALRSGSVSVGRYFSTAVSPMRFAPVGAPPPSAGVAPLEIQRYR
jgi:hypothetical protein